MENRITGILLAAGESARFGSNKLLHSLPDSDTPIAIQAANNLLEVLPHSVAVVKPNDKELISLLSQTGVTIVENPDTHLGMSSSIRCAINAIESGQVADTRGYIIALADMPYIPQETYKQVLNGLANSALICAPQYNKKRGHPVGFSSKLKHELLKLEGDVGAKAVIDKHINDLQIIESSSDKILRDIDKPEDIIN